MLKMFTFARDDMLLSIFTFLAILLASLLFTRAGNNTCGRVIELLFTIISRQGSNSSVTNTNKNPTSPIKDQPRNAQVSSLLFNKLPPELRRSVFAFVLGGNRYHVEYFINPAMENFTLRLKAGVCRGSMALPCPAVSPKGYRSYLSHTEYDYQPAPDWEHEQIAIVTGTRQSKDLRDHRFCTLPWVARKPSALMSLLTTCRAIYFEAHSILYSDNIFAFDDAVHLERLSSMISSIALNNIRNLEVYVVSSGCQKNMEIFAKCTKDMKQLRRVVVAWRHDIWEGSAPKHDRWDIAEREIRDLLDETAAHGTELYFESFEGRRPVE